MNKFSSLDISRFKLTNLVGIVGETLDLAIPVASLLGDVGVKIVTKLTANLSEMKSEMDRSRKSPLTEPVKKANNECDATFNEIKRSAKTGEQSTIPVKAEAGKTLMFFLEPFWHLDKEPLVSQIGMTEELLQRYNNQSHLQIAAQTLSIEVLFPMLGQQTATLNSLYNQRLTEQSAESPAASNMRGVVVEGYGGLTDIVVKVVNLEPAPEQIVDLFHKMDYLRKKYSAITPARIDIKNAVTEPIDTQKHTGKAITPIPVAYYEGTELTFAKDFNVTYKHNVEVGEAMVILHGKGKFSGSHERRFNIER